MNGKRAILWGIGDDYERIINQVKFEELKGNLKVIALVEKKENRVSSKRDGYKVILKEELNNIIFDYLIVCSSRFFSEIKLEALKILGGETENKRIINGTVFLMPLFDFGRYINLVENPVTILSNDCWGGVVYSSLNLVFSSPTVNTFIYPDSYAKLIENPLYYFAQSMTIYREGDIREGLSPIGQIGEGENKIHISFPHSVDYASAAKEWNRRKKRVNKENIFVKISYDSLEKDVEKIFEVYERLPYKKVFFYNGRTKNEKVTYLPRFEKWAKREKSGTDINFRRYMLDWDCRRKAIDILKLLNGEKDWIRD